MTETTNPSAAPQTQLMDKPSETSLVAVFAKKYGVEATKLLHTLKMTAFRQKPKYGEEKPLEVTMEQMVSLLVVANQYGLNPFTREIYAFPSDGGIVPMVGVDGWMRIINEQPTLESIEFRDVGEIVERKLWDGTGQYKKEHTRKVPEGMACSIKRADRKAPIEVIEWFDECARETKPWAQSPRRMLRHKALIQCARLVFSLVGIYDEDEGQRIIEGEATVVTHGPAEGMTSPLAEKLKPNAAPEPAIVEGDIVEGEIVESKDDAPESFEDDEEGEPAPGNEASAAPQAERDPESTAHLLQCIMDAETVEELDYIRSVNDKRQVSAEGRKTVQRSLDEKAKKLATEAKD